MESKVSEIMKMSQTKKDVEKDINLDNRVENVIKQRRKY